MELLCNYQHSVCAENIPCPIHALICRKACMVHEYVFGRYAAIHGKAFHNVDLVIVVPAVVAAHEQLVGYACAVSLYTDFEPVLEYVARAIIPPHAEHEYAVKTSERLCFLYVNYSALRREQYDYVYHGKQQKECRE